MAVKQKIKIRDLRGGDVFFCREKDSDPYVFWIRTNEDQRIKRGKRATVQYRCICLNGTVDDVWWDDTEEVFLAMRLKEWRRLADQIRFEEQESRKTDE